MKDIIENCGIPVESARPEDLISLDTDAMLPSNSNRTISLEVFSSANGDPGMPMFLEKTIRLNPHNSGNSGHNELLFYGQIRDRLVEFPGIHCPKAHAIRWQADNILTFRMDFVSGSVIAESMESRAAAMAAVGRIANHFYKNPDRLPDWLVQSEGVGAGSGRELSQTTKLFEMLDLGDRTHLLHSFYYHADQLTQLYRRSPMSLAHCDASHNNVRSLPFENATLFLDWPKVKIASVAEDAARLLQPWLLIYNAHRKAEDLLRIEHEMMRSFEKQLTHILSDEISFVRTAYDIRSVANAITTSGHILAWIEIATDNEIRKQRMAFSRGWYDIITHRIERLVADIDRTEQLAKLYPGKEIAERVGNERWQREHKAVEAFLAGHFGETVLDFPVAAGRFIQLYAVNGMSVIAADASADKLAEASAAAARIGFKDLTLTETDATGLDTSENAADVAVCMRYLNLLPPDRARTVFLFLADRCKDEMLITLTSIDERKFEGEERERIETQLRNTHTSNTNDDSPPSGGAHSYLDFLEWVHAGGMELVSSELLEEGRDELRVEIHRLQKR